MVGNVRLNKVLAVISKKSGNGTRIKGAYVDSDEFDKMNQYAINRKKSNSDPKRKPYKITNNNCGHFAQGCIEAGNVSTPWYIDPRPNSYINEMRGKFQNVDFDPNTNTTRLKKE